MEDDLETIDLGDMREDYRGSGLERGALAADPVDQFRA